MIVGFKILDLLGFKQEAIDYISSVIYVPNPIEVATNIVNKYATTNIFSSKVTQDDLNALPFTTQAIEHLGGIFCWSIIDFPIEMPYRAYDNSVRYIRLMPTEYVDELLYSVAKQLQWYKDQNYIAFIPDVVSNEDWSQEDFSPEDWLTPNI